jgi:hypothetical protein
MYYCTAPLIKINIIMIKLAQMGAGAVGALRIVGSELSWVVSRSSGSPPSPRLVFQYVDVAAIDALACLLTLIHKRQQ